MLCFVVSHSLRKESESFDLGFTSAGSLSYPFTTDGFAVQSNTRNDRLREKAKCLRPKSVDSKLQMSISCQRHRHERRDESEVSSQSKITARGRQGNDAFLRRMCDDVSNRRHRAEMRQREHDRPMTATTGTLRGRREDDSETFLERLRRYLSRKAESCVPKQQQNDGEITFTPSVRMDRTHTEVSSLVVADNKYVSMRRLRKETRLRSSVRTTKAVRTKEQRIERHRGHF